MPFATDEEITIAHDILLNDKKPFDPIKVNIIKEDIRFLISIIGFIASFLVLHWVQRLGYIQHFRFPIVR